MNNLKKLFRNRNFLLILAVILGFLIGAGARWTKPMIIPALAMVMTVSIMGIPGSIFRSPRTLIFPALVGLLMNYGLMSGLIFFLNSLLIQVPFLKNGFIFVLAAPPAVAVIPFSILLKGDGPFSLLATISCYLAALALMPLITLVLLGPEFVDREKVLMILVELIILPFFISRLLCWSGLSKKIDPYKGAITNWGFFLVVYTIVGLNQSIFLNHPLILIPVSLIALASTFLLGFGIEKIARVLHADPRKMISLLLLGTQKNTGLAAGLALTLFDERTALPATVFTIFMIFYFIWLSLKQPKLIREK